MIELRIRAAEPGDFDVARDMLAAEGLPVEDLAADYLVLSAVIDEDLHGIIGLESFGRLGLLRSLVISPAARGRGVGTGLVAALEEYAASLGISELWLLTINADPFFAGLGYASEERANAPERIRETPEFSSLCPDDAVLMRKSLG